MIRRTTRSIGVLGAVGLRTWVVRCSGRWHGAGRRWQQRRGGTPEHQWLTAVATFGTAAAPSAAVLRGYCGSTTRFAAAPAGSARLVCGRGGCYARNGGRHRVAHALRGTRWWYGYSGVRVVSRVGTRGRHGPSGPHGGRRAAQSLAAAHRTDDRWFGGGGCARRSHGADLARPAAPAPSMRPESAVAGMSLQMTWAGRSRQSSAG